MYANAGWGHTPGMVKFSDRLNSKKVKHIAKGKAGGRSLPRPVQHKKGGGRNRSENEGQKSR